MNIITEMALTQLGLYGEKMDAVNIPPLARRLGIRMAEKILAAGGAGEWAGISEADMEQLPEGVGIDGEWTLVDSGAVERIARKAFEKRIARK